MRQPASPPSIADLSTLFLGPGTGATHRLLAVRTDQPYWHWDELRRRPLPEGLDHEEWWFVTKLVRSTAYRTLPLQDQAGRPFVYSLPDEVLQETEFIASNASGRIGQPELVTDPATRDGYVVSSLMEEAITSSQLEGASTTRRIAKELLRSGRAPRDRSERMVLNNFLAMERVGDLRYESLTPELICELHRIVTDGTLDSPGAAGRYQLPSETRVAIHHDQGGLLYQPPPAGEIPGRIEELCAFANGAGPTGYLPGVLRAIALHFMLGYIHPFEDGNGRSARALFYWSMLNQGYWLTEFLSVSPFLRQAPAKYGRSFLYTETDDNDLTYFFIYHLEILHRAIDALQAHLVAHSAQLQKVRSLLGRGADRLNTRQLALLGGALKRPAARYTVRSHMRSHRIALEIARQDLVGLVDLGLLGVMAAPESYVPVANLEQALSQVGETGADR
jgi:Fic family protein